MPPLQGEWLEALKPEFGKPYYKQLFAKVGQEYQTYSPCRRSMKQKRLQYRPIREGQNLSSLGHV